MKMYRGVDVWIHIFFTSALAEGEWSASSPSRLTPVGRVLGTHSIGGWMSPRAGLDEVEKRKYLTLPGLKIRPLGSSTGKKRKSLIRIVNQICCFFKMQLHTNLHSVSRLLPKLRSIQSRFPETVFFFILRFL
jgi:hypothetical protein